MHQQCLLPYYIADKMLQVDSLPVWPIFWGHSSHGSKCKNQIFGQLW